MESQNKKIHQLVMAAVFAAAITVTTAYVLHIPIPTGGYLHLGDTLIYLGACLLPLPWAMGAAAVGAALADLLTAPMWALATFLIKALMCLPFARKSKKLLCGRNIAAVVIAGVGESVLYSFVNAFFMASMAGFLPQFIGTMIQATASGVLFLVIAAAVDKVGLKDRLPGV